MNTSELAVQTLFSLLAVITGGFIATAGAIFSNSWLEWRKQQH